MINPLIVTSVVLKVIAILLIAVFVLPIQYKELLIKDKLLGLRRALYWMIVTYLGTTIIIVIWNISRLFDDSNVVFFTNIISAMNSTSNLIIGIFLIIIYHSHYNKEN